MPQYVYEPTLPRVKDFTFRSSQAALDKPEKERNSKEKSLAADPAKLFVRGPIHGESKLNIGARTTEVVRDAKGGAKAIPKPFEMPKVILEEVFNDPQTRWNITDANNEDIPVSLEVFWEKVSPEDQDGIIEDLFTWYQPQLSQLDAAPEDLESSDPNSETAPDETLSAESDLKTSLPDDPSPSIELTGSL